MKNASLEFKPAIPQVVPGHGRDMDDRKLPAIMTHELPAPKFSLELTFCKCKKTQCKTKMCSFFKQRLRCTNACNCIDCTIEDDEFIK